MAWFGRESASGRVREARFRQWIARQSPLAMASAVLGVFSLTHLGVLLFDAIVAIVLGVMAFGRIRARPAHETEPIGRSEGRWLAILGIGAASLSLLMAATLYFWPLIEQTPGISALERP